MRYNRSVKKNIFFLLILLVGLGVLAFQGWRLYQSGRITTQEHSQGQAEFDAFLKTNEPAPPLFSVQAELVRIDGSVIHYRYTEPAQGGGSYVNYSYDALELSPDTRFYVLTGEPGADGQPQLFAINIENVLPGDKISINLRADKERTAKPEIYSIYVLDY